MSETSLKGKKYLIFVITNTDKEFRSKKFEDVVNKGKASHSQIEGLTRVNVSKHCFARLNCF